MTDKEKQKINDEISRRIYGGSVVGKKYFNKGLLKRHLIIEAGSKISNKLKIKSGEESVSKIKNLQEQINKLKYMLPEHGSVAMVKSRTEQDTVYLGKVLESDDYGTDTLYFLRLQVREIKVKNDKYRIEEVYQLDPRTPDKKSFVVKTEAFNVESGEIISLAKLNKLLGRKFFNQWEVLETGYIPAEIFYNSFDGESDIEGLEEIFLLERQLYKEIPRDLDLSRKKVLYKTRLARKKKPELEIEMNNDTIVVFEDGNAVFTSPIDLWAPALIIESITRVIDWLVNYVLKMKFAAKDSMSTGAQKTDDQVSEINQSAQNYLEDKIQMLSLYMNLFLRKVLNDDEIEIEFELMTTVNRLVNGGTPPNPNNEPGQGVA